jgi:hypothetical protein
MPDPIQLIGALLDKIGAQEIEFATSALMRFCAQSLDASAPLYLDCVGIVAAVAAGPEASGRWDCRSRFCGD